MKATGIVRRIDDLGRVVIPKEIRRTMRLREGDPLEIYTNMSGEVIFKKYSPMGELSDGAEELARTLFEEIKIPLIICDRDHAVACAGISKLLTENKRITPELESIMEQRKLFKPDGETKALEFLNDNIMLVSPVISAGDITGAIVLLSGKSEKELTLSDERLISVASQFLGSKT